MTNLNISVNSEFAEIEFEHEGKKYFTTLPNDIIGNYIQAQGWEVKISRDYMHNGHEIHDAIMELPQLEDLDDDQWTEILNAHKEEWVLEQQ